MAISTNAFGTFVYVSIRKQLGKLGIKWNGQAPNSSVVRSDISSFNEEGLYVIVSVLLDVLSKLVVNFEDIFLMP